MGEIQENMVQKPLDRTMKSVVQDKIDTLLTKKTNKDSGRWAKNAGEVSWKQKI